MKKIFIGLIAVAAFTFSASAQDNTDQKKWNGNGSGMHKDHDGKGLQALNLTPAQKQQIKSINEDFKTRMQSLNSNDNILVKDQRAQRKALMDERNSKISALLTPEQKTQFDKMRQNREGRFGGEMGRDRDNKMERMKTNLGLTDDQLAKMKANNQSFKQKAEAIRNNQSLNEDQKKAQFEILRKEREANLKNVLTADQIARLDAMKKNRGDWKKKEKGDGWKEKRKSEDGKEKIKVKTS